MSDYDYNPHRRDAVAQLPDELRRRVEADLIDPRYTLEEVWKKHGLDRPESPNYIANSTFERCGKVRRDDWNELQRQAALKSLSVRVGAVKQLRQEIGSLGDAAVDLLFGEFLAEMAADGVNPKLMALRARTIRDIAGAFAKADAERRAAAISDRMHRALTTEAGKSADGKLDAGQVVDLIDRVMRGEVAA
jgi:hypothetical protein